MRRSSLMNFSLLLWWRWIGIVVERLECSAGAIQILCEPAKIAKENYVRVEHLCKYLFLHALARWQVSQHLSANGLSKIRHDDDVISCDVRMVVEDIT